MTVKKWLGRARYIEREIALLQKTKQETRDQLTKITQSYEDNDGVQSTKDPHKFDRLAEFDSLIDEKVDELYAVKMEIMQAIFLLDDRLQKIVLLSYYVRMKTFEQIAVEQNYSFRQITNIRRHGIVELQRLIGDKLKQSFP